ncbi:hypothetical protein PO909_023072 [Leuciscus waleckii]
MCLMNPSNRGTSASSHSDTSQSVINVPEIPEIHARKSGNLRSISIATQTKQNIPKPKKDRKKVLEEQTAVTNQPLSFPRL